LVASKDTHLVSFLDDKVKAGKGKAAHSREWKEADAAKVLLATKTSTTGADYERGFQLVGLNSASFKSAANFSAAPAGAPGTPAYEMQRMKSTVMDGGSYLVFTHIPDLNDPAALKAKSGGAPDPKKIVKEVVNRAKGTEPSAWQLDPTFLGDWNKLASKSELVGIFAGHFHSSNRALYGVASEDHPLAVRRDVAAKTWVAPPLAVKYQFAKPERVGAADNAVTQTARGFLVANVSSTGATTVSLYWYGTLDPKSVSDADIALAEANAEALDEHWDKAAAKYAEAMKSTDSRVRATATAGYLRARGKMRTWWWQLSPVRWVWVHRIFALWIVGIALVLLLVSAIFKGHGVFSWISWIVEKVFMPRFTGHATIQTPAALTKDAPVDLFAAELSKGARQVTEVLEWFGVNTFGGSVTLLSMPSEVTTKMAQDFPAVVKGVDLTKIFEFLLAMTRYFTWRVESKMGFCPDPPTGAVTTSGPGGEVHAFATLRWAWFCVGDWGLKRRATSQFDVNPAAFSLAARILWKAIRK
jgi:hypothetical protein